MRSELDGISIVICTYKGEEELPGCLAAIQDQKWHGNLEIIVVNDDPNIELVVDTQQPFPVNVLNNKANLGPAGARNVGIRHARFSLVAFTDDDCRPHPEWLQELAFTINNGDSAVAAGGKTLPQDSSSIVLRYLSHNNPIQPLELEVGGHRSNLSRLISYAQSLVQSGTKAKSDIIRPVYSLPSANLAVKTAVILDLGMFDEEIEFSGEDQDLCRRLLLKYPAGIIYNPSAVVYHKYRKGLRDTLRRSKAYAEGNFALRLKWPKMGLVVFPTPIVWFVASVTLGVFQTNLIWLPSALLPLCYPKYLQTAFKSSAIEPLIYFSINFLQDCWANFGLFNAIFSRLFTSSHRSQRVNREDK